MLVPPTMRNKLYTEDIEDNNNIRNYSPVDFY